MHAEFLTHNKHSINVGYYYSLRRVRQVGVRVMRLWHPLIDRRYKIKSL
jgi:hypothetical protein